MVPVPLLFLGLCAGLPAVRAQEPAAAQVMARYELFGEPGVVTRGDVALEMAFHQRRMDAGREACKHLVDSLLVRRQAEQRGLWPQLDEVQRFWTELQRQLRAAGRDPQQEPIVRNSDERTLLDDLAVTIAHEKLVRAELELRPDERVSPEMLSLWLQDTRKRLHVVDDPDQLPLGSAAQIDGAGVPILDLGLLMLRKSEPEEQDRFVRQVVVLQGLDTLARRHEVTVDEQDLKAELAARRALAGRDPRFAGMTFEQLLKTQGLTPELLLQSRVFRAQVLQQKLAARLHPRADLLAEIARDRQAVLDAVGPRRHLGVIYCRALEAPNALVPHDFPAAMRHLATVKQRLAKDPFDVVARIESDDPGSKGRGGDLGWLQRASKTLPEPVLAAAFALPAGEVSEPIRAVDGCYLVKVLEVEPDPDDEALLLRLRDQYAAKLTQELLDQARIVRADGTPLGAQAPPGQEARK